MDPESAEFQDWEVLHNSDDSVIVKSLDSVGIIRSDYFSLHNHPNNNNLSTFTEVVTDEASVEPDTLNSIDPPRPGGFSSHGDCKFSRFDGKNELGVDENEEPQLGHDRIGKIVGESENSGEFRSDSSGVKPISSKIGDFGERTEMGIDENDEPQFGHDGIGEIVGESENSREFRSDSSGVEPISSKIGDLGETIEMGIGENDEPQLGHDGIGEIVAESEDSGEFRSDSSGGESISIKIEDLGETPEMANTENAMEISGGEKIEGEGKELNENESVAIEAIQPGGEEENRRMVWWKLPLDLLRYCAFRVSPVWTVSVAAAVLGFVILGRRLHKMKRKSRSLQLKVTIDDKKVSQFMSKAARLNEAFSVVKRVPVIRPSLPAAGVTPWPVMNLR